MEGRAAHARPFFLAKDGHRPQRQETLGNAPLSTGPHAILEGRWRVYRD